MKIQKSEYSKRSSILNSDYLKIGSISSEDQQNCLTPNLEQIDEVTDEKTKRLFQWEKQRGEIWFPCWVRGSKVTKMQYLIWKNKTPVTKKIRNLFLIKGIRKITYQNKADR